MIFNFHIFRRPVRLLRPVFLFDRSDALAGSAGMAAGMMMVVAGRLQEMGGEVDFVDIVHNDHETAVRPGL